MAQADAQRIIRMLREHTLPDIADITGIPLADLHAQLADPVDSPPLPVASGGGGGGGGGVPDRTRRVERKVANDPMSGTGGDAALIAMLASNGSGHIPTLFPTEAVLVEAGANLQNTKGEWAAVTPILTDPNGNPLALDRAFFQVSPPPLSAGKIIAKYPLAFQTIPTANDYTNPVPLGSVQLEDGHIYEITVAAHSDAAPDGLSSPGVTSRGVPGAPATLVMLGNSINDTIDGPLVWNGVVNGQPWDLQATNRNYVFGGGGQIDIGLFSFDQSDPSFATHAPLDVPIDTGVVLVTDLTTLSSEPGGFAQVPVSFIVPAGWEYTIYLEHGGSNSTAALQAVHETPLG